MPALPWARWLSHCSSLDVAAGISLTALALVLYLPTLWFDFVSWDDPWYVLHNPHLGSWHPANLLQMATGVYLRNYAPLTSYSLFLDHAVWGFWPAGYHLTNCLLHAVNAVLVYALLVRISKSRFVAWTAAALFAVHPVQIESVAWVSSRKGLLAGGFILATLICWLRDKPTARQQAWGRVFFVLALLSKAIAVVVPGIVFSYDVLILRHTWSTAIRRQIVPGLMAGLLMLVTAVAQSTELGGVRAHFGLSKLEILGIDAVVLWRYVWMLVCPHDLCVLYDVPLRGMSPTVLLSVAGWLTVLVIAVLCRKRAPLAVFALIAAFLFLLPVLNLFPITTLMNDRYLYMPSIPLFALAAGMLDRWRLVHARFPSFRTAVSWTVMLSAVVVFAIVTRAHLPVWENGMSLWTHAVTRASNLAVVQIQYANALHDAGDDAKAIEALEFALASCDPDAADRVRIERKLSDWRP